MATPEPEIVRHARTAELLRAELARADDAPARAYPTELVERYSARTGRDVSDIDYYRAFSAYRLAVIGEGVYARYLNGAMADEIPDLESMKHAVDLRAAWGLEMVRRVRS